MTTLYIEAVGAITAIGYNGERTLASLRSGLDHFREMPFWGEQEDENIIAAPIEGYGEAVSGIRRYEALSLKAIQSCVDSIAPAERENTLIFLGLPHAERVGVPAELASILKQKLSSALDWPQENIKPIQLGRVSVFQGLIQARDILTKNIAQACIIGGVDVLVNGDSLTGLSKAGLIKEEWDGYIPGEGAAFIKVSLQPYQGWWGNAVAAIEGIGIATETADGSANDPLVGVGIRTAFQAAVSDAGRTEKDVHLCINDVNGSRAAFEDEAFGQIRFFRSSREYLEVWHSASYLGETGAAVGAIELIWASAALELGFVPGTGVLISTSDGDLRAAVFLRRTDKLTHTVVNTNLKTGNGFPVLHAVDTCAKHSVEIDDPGLHLSDVDNLHKTLLKENFDELSWLNTVRIYHHEDSQNPWIDIEEFEQRLISHLDALAWSGVETKNLALEALMSEDMEDVAAGAMVLLSFPLDQKVQSLLSDALSESDERCWAIASILPYMPQQNTEPILLYMVSSDTLFQVESAIRVLPIVGWVNENILLQKFDNVPPRLAIPLIEALGAAGLKCLWDLDVKLMKTYPEQLKNVELFGAFANCPKGAKIPVLDLEQLLFSTPVAYALSCMRDKISFLTQIPQNKLPSANIIEAIGWSGEQAAKKILLKVLEEGDNDKKYAATSALYRIFGCELYEEVEVPAPEISEEELSEEKVEIKRLSHNPAVWEEAIDTLSRQKSNDIRLRHGKQWTHKTALYHLQRPEAHYKERMVAAWEYTIVNGVPLPLHPMQFVRPQKEALNILISST